MVSLTSRDSLAKRFSVKVICWLFNNAEEFNFRILKCQLKRMAVAGLSSSPCRGIKCSGLILQALMSRFRTASPVYLLHSRGLNNIPLLITKMHRNIGSRDLVLRSTDTHPPSSLLFGQSTQWKTTRAWKICGPENIKEAVASVATGLA